MCALRLFKYLYRQAEAAVWVAVHVEDGGYDERPCHRGRPRGGIREAPQGGAGQREHRRGQDRVQRAGVRVARIFMLNLILILILIGASA